MSETPVDTLQFVESRYPLSPTVGEGYQQSTLNEYGGLTRPGTRNIGAIAFVNYWNRDGKPGSAIGRVIKSGPAILSIQNEDTGEVSTVDTHEVKVEEVWLKPSTIHWEEANEFEKDLFGKIEEAKEPFVILDGHVLENEHDFVLCGRAKVVDLSPNYKVIQITDKSGRVHTIDPSHLYFKLYYTTASEAEKEDFNLGTEKHSFTEIDTQFEQRLKLVDGLVSDLLDGHTGIYENEKLYDFLNSDTRATRLLIERYYGKQAANLIERVSKEIGEMYLCLLVDPGIVSNFDEFTSFVKDKDLLAVTPLQLRAQFSKHLETTTVYRGMALNIDEQELIKAQGLIAPGFRDGDIAKQILFQTLNYHRRNNEATDIGTSFPEEIATRLRDNSSNPRHFMTMSVSSVREVAESVGFHTSHRTTETGISPCLLTLNIPKLSVIEPVGIFEPENPPKWKVKIADHVFDLDYQQIEMFIPYYVKPNDFKLEQIQTPPTWEKFTK